MEVSIKDKIKDIDEFSKLYKVTVPINKHFDYYVNSLIKSKEYAHILASIQDFVDLESYSKSMGYSSAKAYKLDYALPKILKYLEETKVYDDIKNYQFPASALQIPSKDEIKKSVSDNYWFLSFDICKANYSTFKTLDNSDEMKGSWEELCEFLDIHPTLAKSKSFRQVVFGNTNPKRLQKLQHMLVGNAVEYLKLKGLSEENICFISHDEFVLKFKQTDGNDVWQTSHYSSDAVLKDLSTIMNNVPIRVVIYELDKITKDMFLKTVYSKTEEGILPAYKTLFGAPGNKFYKYFKLYVLKEDLDDRDLYFMNDGEVAKWATDEDSIESSFSPEGELSLDQVKSDYGYFFEKLTRELPSLTESQKRKIISISTTHLCRSCMNDVWTCNCHREE